MIALIGILVCTVSWGSRKLARGWHLKRAGQQLYEDLNSLQARAEISGNLTMNNGALVARRHFLVFEQETQSYAAYSWRDHNGNGFAENGESGRLANQFAARGDLRLGPRDQSPGLQQYQYATGGCHLFFKPRLSPVQLTAHASSSTSTVSAPWARAPSTSATQSSL